PDGSVTAMATAPSGPKPFRNRPFRYLPWYEVPCIVEPFCQTPLYMAPFSQMPLRLGPFSPHPHFGQEGLPASAMVAAVKMNAAPKAAAVIKARLLIGDTSVSSSAPTL